MEAGKPKLKKVDLKNGIRKFSSDIFEQNLIDFILMAKKEYVLKV